MKTEIILSVVLLLFLSACASKLPKAETALAKNYITLNNGGAPARIKAKIIKQDYNPVDAIPARMFVLTGLSARSVPPARTDKAGRSVFSSEVLKEKIKAALPEKATFLPLQTKNEPVVKPRQVSTKITKEQKQKRLTIYFDFDSSIIPQSELIKLNLFAKNLNQHAGQPVRPSVRIDGYASPSGSTIHNRVLSLKRALSVEKYLISHNVRVATVIGRGEIKAPQSKLSRKAIIAVSRKEGCL